jgi:hypothetical protein
LFLTFAYFYQGGFANNNSRFDLSLALALEHRFTIDSFHQNTIDKAFYSGHYFSEKAPGTSYLALPVPALASLYWNTADLYRDPGIADWLLYATTVGSLSFLSALSAIFFRRFLVRLNPDRTEREALLLTVLAYLGTLVWPYSTLLFSHQLAGVLLLLASYLGFVGLERDPIDGKRLAGASILFSWAVLVEYPAALPAVVLTAGLLAGARHFKRLLPYALFAIPAAALLLFHNRTCFGNPFALGYAQLQSTPFSEEMGKGFYGIVFPRPQRILQLLFGGYRGLFVYCPPLILAALAAPKGWKSRHRRFLASVAIAVCGVILLNASYGYWQGGVCFGPRHLVPIVLLFALNLAFVPASWLRSPVFFALAILAMAINGVGTATTPFVSEYDTNPLLHSYRQLASSGAVAYNPIGFLTPHTETRERWAHPDRWRGTSFNWGQRLGLTGWWSLVPLALLWGLFAARAWRKESERG